MAYMSQENKKSLMPAIKAVLKKYKMKASVGVRHHSSLVCNIVSGEMDLSECFSHGDGYAQVNTYHIDRHYEGKVKSFLNELLAAMSTGNHDRSDIMTDYFDVGWYSNINIGQYHKPYVQVSA